MREPFRTSFLSASVTAGPEEVWWILAGGGEPGVEVLGAMLPDRQLLSDWRPGSSVRLSAAGTDVYGTVLRATAPYRLTYTLGAPQPDGQDSTVIVTWEVQPAADGGSVLMLAVDDLYPDGADDLRDAWASVLAEVRGRLEILAPPVGETPGSDRA
ncbi:SRPBCC domain-containing protein [Frankia sp. CNm7]|uniref:SRPBCC domain-containing protein n=2 Tax=Frankia nepalensis TaxID=1836974 RepID=A0A937RKR4_9ACTN|nr:SRPBCC domain-containing protein [Frankia nepalensis]MBL7502001.1 SRPBCC domain-containing protein [Frankia nepalensis]MBL7516346.1 SRPBCC domain-containing protein [Frankia nepalensis]MBL7519745.1 SRPBCC domain-containing protein [Frankia nepalensis]MBL7632082.1 SRPBCC domain-containing protein [Frankia nepalensis]